VKLTRAIQKFNPAKGTGFTYVSKIIDSALRTRVTATRKDWLRYCELDADLANSLHAKADDRSTIDDVVQRVRALARTC
jgi:hypothetical protein